MTATRDLIPRHAARLVRDALADTRAVLLNGARQVGKSTLAEDVMAGVTGARMFTLDDDAVLAAAHEDPVSFVRQQATTLAIDEVQRAPELFRAIKAAVDRDNRPGQFLLTGSAQILTIPRLADTLAGRMEIVELWPFSQGELRRRRERFVDDLLAGGEGLRAKGELDKRGYVELAVSGGYPEAIARASERRRARWFGAYLQTVTQRGARELADIDRLRELPRLLRLIVARAGGLLNVDGLSRDSMVPASTLRRYLGLLETIFLVHSLPAWSNNKTIRAIRAPKVYLTDSGLAAHLLNATASALFEPPGDAGPILETFVVGELRRLLTWAEERASLHHFRTKEGVGVDVVLETADGRVAGVEVKAGATVTGSEFRGLRLLSAKAGRRFTAGVVLYTGTQPLPFGDKLWALPISSLWHTS